MKECLGKQKTEEKEQDVPDDQLFKVCQDMLVPMDAIGSPSSPNLYEDAEWSELSMKDLVAVETTANAFIRELDAARQRLRAARARSEPEFVDAGESVDEATASPSSHEDAEWSELSMKDIRAIETTARAFTRELDAARERLRMARARSEPEFEAERRVRARRLVQVLTSCPPTPETAESPLPLSPTHSPRAATGGGIDLEDRLLDIHEAAMEETAKTAIHDAIVKHRKKRLMKKHFDNLPDHAKELMLEVGKRGGAQGSKTRIVNTMFEKDPFDPFGLLATMDTSHKGEYHPLADSSKTSKGKKDDGTAE